MRLKEAAPDWQLIETIWITDDCDSYGTAKYVCLNCGEQKEELATPRGHKWDNGVVTTEPTDETDGVRTYTCSRCRETRTEAIARLATPLPVITSTPQPTYPSETPYPAEPSEVPQPTASSEVPQPGDGVKASVTPGKPETRRLSHCHHPRSAQIPRQRLKAEKS